jgi:hypothetical protein
VSGDVDECPPSPPPNGPAAGALPAGSLRLIDRAAAAAGIVQHLDVSAPDGVSHPAEAPQRGPHAEELARAVGAAAALASGAGRTGAGGAAGLVERVAALCLAQMAHAPRQYLRDYVGAVAAAAEAAAAAGPSAPPAAAAAARVAAAALALRGRALDELRLELEAAVLALTVDGRVLADMAQHLRAIAAAQEGLAAAVRAAREGLAGPLQAGCGD